MPSLSGDKLTEKIKDVFNRKTGVCLFAGAGVSMRAGLPSWEEYINHLIQVAERYEQETAVLMRKKLSEHRLLEAAHLYKTCTLIPNGEMLKQLGEPFKTYSYKKLRALSALPFSAVVTTNYDHSLHDAYCALFDSQEGSGLKLKSPQFVELGDESMKQAIYWTDFYIARIHGRAEIPGTIVLDNDDYRNVLQNPSYRSFLMHIFTTYSCFWVGYSFLDPAILKVFELMKELPKPYPQLHVALIPSNSDPKLNSELAKYNVEVIVYDADNNHVVLWESIKNAQRSIRTLPRKAPNMIESIPGLGRFIASCYSRLAIGNRAEPLLKIIAEGIISQLIFDSGAAGISRNILVESLKQYITLSETDLDSFVRDATIGLIDKGLCSKDKELYRCSVDDKQYFNIAMESLIESVLNRLRVREGLDIGDRLKTAINTTLNKIFLIRGWDLGAHFAGGGSSTDFDAWDQIQILLSSILKGVSDRESRAIANAMLDLFRHPNVAEAAMLLDIGRVSFGVELVLKNSHLAKSNTLLIPENIYLDSNVLMPAIIDGHPYSSVYNDAIIKLQQQAARDGNIVRVCIAEEFLNEIVSHRRLAIEQVRSNGLENVEKLRNYVLFYSSINTNVYIGAYASYVDKKSHVIPFNEFLNRIAPYNNEESLSGYLQKRGINPVSLRYKNDAEILLYHEMKEALEIKYEETLRNNSKYEEPKASILIEHEAAQLARLFLDLKMGLKPIFVTADRRLMSLCTGPNLERCANAIMSNLGFIQLVDLVAGIDTDKRSLSRLFWSVNLSDEKVAIRNYLIDLALQKYDEALTKAAWETVDIVTEQMIRRGRVENIHVFSSRQADRIKNANFLDSFEEDYFKNMSEILTKKEKKIGN